MHKRTPSIYILNDTSHGHCGSRKVMDMIYRYLSGFQILGSQKTNGFADKDLFDRADCIIANGEGTMHHDQVSATYIVHLLYLAQRTGKRTALFNSIWQGMDTNHNKILEKLDYISARDSRSAKALGDRSKCFLDLSMDKNLIPHSINPTSDVIYIGAQHPAVDTHILDKLSYPKLSLSNSFDSIVHTLRRAKLYITGQFHGICAAILAGCPFIPMQSNSYKIDELVGSDIPMLTDIADVDKCIKWSEDNRKWYLSFFESILSRPTMSKEDFNQMVLGTV